MKKLKESKGSVTLFVLIAMMFFLIVLVLLYMNLNDKLTGQRKELGKIQTEYSDSDLNQVYDESLKNTDMQILIALYKVSGETYSIDEWTNQSLKLKIYYPDDVKEENRYYYKDNVKIKYNENQIIESNCTIAAEYKDRRKEVKITRIDKILPTVSIAPNGGTYTMPTTGNATIKSTLSGTDLGGSGLDLLQYAWSASNTTEPTSWTNFTNTGTVSKTDCTAGNYYLWTKVIDKAGNRASSTKVSNGFVVKANTDQESQITITPSTTNWTNQNITATIIYGSTLTSNKKAGFGISVSEAESKAQGSTATSVTITANGYVYAEGTDEAGNKIVKTIQVTNIEKIEPTVTITPNGGTYTMLTTGNATIKSILNAVDTGGSGLNVSQYAWSISNTTEPTSWINFTNGVEISKTDCTQGTYYLWTRVVDKAGNRASNIKISNGFIVKANTDSTAIITITPNTTAWTNQNITATVSYGSLLTANKKAGYGTTVANAQTAATAAQATSVNVTDNGYVYAEATDSAGNKITKSLQITNIDKILPTVTVAPNGGTYTMPTTGNATIKSTLSGTDLGGSGLDLLQYAWSASNTTEPTSWTNFTNTGTVSKTDCTAGNYYLWTKVIDKAGNRASSTKVSNGFVVKANTDQESQITITPSTTNWTNQNITATVSYGSLLTANKKAGYGATVAAAQTAASTSTANTVTATANGYIYAEATDSAGNKITKSLQITNIDKTPPVINTYSGSRLYNDPTFASGMNSVNIYNNSGGGTVTHTRKAMADNPEGSGYGIEIKTSGVASPGHGGFHFATGTSASKEYVTRIVAKIPAGYNINWASNAYGTGGQGTEWLTSTAGTGKWEEYIFRVKCGSSGSFSSTNFYYLTGGSTATASSPVIWQVGYATVIDTSKWSTEGFIISSGADSQSRVSAYGMNQSSTTQPTWTGVTANQNIGKIVNSLTANGTYYIWMKDAVGNVSNKAVALNYIDRTAPTVTMTPNGGTYTMPTTGNATIKSTLTAADTGGSGLNLVQYAWSTSNTAEPSAWTNFTNGSTVSKTDCTVGTYYLWTKVTDQAGNRSSSVKISNGFVVKANTDSGATITITPNTTVWTNQNITAAITYGSTLTANKKAGYGATVAAAQTAASTSTANTVTVTANGYVYAEATDNAGNKITKSLQLTNIDKTAPSITKFETKEKTVLDENLTMNLQSNGTGNTSAIWKNQVSGTNGAINGATWTSDGLSFDGVNDWVNLGEINTKTATYDITFSLNQDTTNKKMYLLSNEKDAGVSIYIENNVIKARAYIKALEPKFFSLTGTTKLEIGKTYRVRLSSDAQIVALYLNDNLEMKESNSLGGFIGYPSSNTVMALGVNPNGSQANTGYFNGKIYSVKIYDKGEVPGIDCWHFAVKAEAQDSQAGLKQYQFYIDGKLDGTLVTKEPTVEYLYKNATSANARNLEVKVMDMASNVASKSISTTIVNGVEVSNITRNGFDVTIYTASNIEKVQVPTWTAAIKNGSVQDDLTWYTATKVATGKWTTHINVANHNYEFGSYLFDVYRTINGEVKQPIYRKVVEIPADQISVGNITREGYDVYLTTGLSGITAVSFPTWTSYNGQDDLVRAQGSNLGNGVWRYRVNVWDHKYEAGDYITHVYPYVNGKDTYSAGITTTVPNTEYYAIKNVSSSGYDVVAYLNRSGVSRVQFPTWTNSNGQDDIIWGEGTHRGNNSWYYRVNTSEHRYENGQYNTHIYATINGTQTGVWGGSANISGSVTPPPPHTSHTYNARGSTVKNVGYGWNCSGGHYHTTAYYIYCSVCGVRKTSGGGTLMCPSSPYGPAQGWGIIAD